MVEKAAEFIKSKIDGDYEIGIICGSGLGGLCDKVENPIYVNYADIPNFPVSTAPGHIGRFVFGVLSGKKVVCMQGRVHYYEGYSPESVVMPVRVMKLLGVKKLIVTNAAGGINESFNVGDIMLITDHINFTGTNPLIGKNDDRFGVRFPDMSFAYSPFLRETAIKCAEKMKLNLREGVYLGCSGPSYETPAEIRAFRTLGADTVGMSTVMEVIAANHCKMEVLGFSLVANKAAGMSGNRLTEQEVIDIGKQKADEMQKLVSAVVGEI
ncbi:MAG: purine-nucleoside phosphorylase [Oscillospiraceae bacterium]|nr:purine-nucleoside phosphorylase [Oscillospiraceae bacterium]